MSKVGSGDFRYELVPSWPQDLWVLEPRGPQVTKPQRV